MTPDPVCVSADASLEGALSWMKSRRLRRLVHTQELQAAAIQLSPTAENRSGNIEIKSALNGRVTHAGAARYRGLDGQHLLFAAVRIGEIGYGDGGVRFSPPYLLSSIWSSSSLTV